MILAGSSISTYLYAATKYAVTALTEGTRRELRAMKSRVRVTVSAHERLCALIRNLLLLKLIIIIYV